MRHLVGVMLAIVMAAALYFSLSHQGQAPGAAGDSVVGARLAA